MLYMSESDKFGVLREWHGRHYDNKNIFFYFHYEVNLKIHSCKIFLLNNSRIFPGKSIFFENYEVYESDNMADAKKKFVMVILTTTLYHLIKSTIVIIFYTIKYG